MLAFRYKMTTATQVLLTTFPEMAKDRDLVPLMRRMGINQHHALGVLRDNIGTVKMRDSKAQGWHITPLKHSA